MKQKLGARSFDVSTLYRKYGIVCVMVLLIVTATILNKNFLSLDNITNILKQISPFVIIAAAETMLIVSGCIDLAAGASAALAACISAGTLASTQSLALSFLVGMGSAAGLSYISGILVTVFRLPSFIATLAMMNVAQGLVVIYTHGTTIVGLEKLRWLSSGRLFELIPYMIITTVVVLVIIQIVMRNTKFGLNMYAIGGNSKAAVAAGINTNRQIRLTYLLSGCLVGLAGIVLNARMMAASPNVGPGYEFDAITATIVGGTSFTGGAGSMHCVVIGAVIIGVINNIMILMGVDTSWQMIVKGALIALAVILDIATKGGRKK